METQTIQIKGDNDAIAYINFVDRDLTVSIGYAEKREFEIEKQIGYYVSELGLKYLGVLLECIIIEEE